MRPSVLPDEYKLLGDASCIARCARRRDVHLAGDVVRCLRVFGLPKDDARIVKGCDFLAASQTSSGVDEGGWPTRDGDVTSYAAFHAAAKAVGALYEPDFRGFGPALRELAPADGFAACGAVLRDDAAMAAMASSYKADAHDGEERRVLASLSLVERATRRLAGLLKWHAAMQSRSIDDYDVAPARKRVKRLR